MELVGLDSGRSLRTVAAVYLERQKTSLFLCWISAPPPANSSGTCLNIGFSTEWAKQKTDGEMAGGGVSNIHNQVGGQIELGSKWVALHGH